MKILAGFRRLRFRVPFFRVSIGKGVTIRGQSSILFKGSASIGNFSTVTSIGGTIEIGDGFSCNERVSINADFGGSISIGKNCLIGPGVVLRSANHIFENPNLAIKAQGHNFKDIVLGDSVWIGANAVILAGVTIGENSVIGAGAVVTKDIPKFVVAAGVPARIIRRIG